MKLLRYLLACIFVLIFSVTSLGSEETKAGKVIIIIDASGSMWGEIGGEPKIVIARRVIRDLIRNWDPRIELGLVAYGHRRKADCKDIELLVPIGRGKEKAVLSAINQLKPKGKTPLSDAVRIAADALKYTEERATVILVSDGKETCEADPCALGKELEDKGIDFTAHVVGFDVKKVEEAGLRCLAKNTGGLYATAHDAGSLKQALEKTVTEVKKKVAQPLPQKTTAKPGIKIVTTYKKNGAEFKGDINLYVLEKKADLSGKRKKIAEKHRGKSGHIFRNLPAGKHIVTVRLSDHGYIQREYEIEVIEGKTVSHELVLDIGTVRFDALLKKDGKSFKGDLGWDILSPKADLSGKHRKLTNFWRMKSGKIFILPAGKWLISGIMADWKHVGTQKKEIAVESAGEEAHTFVFNAGTVRFDALLKEGGEPFKGDLGWDVLYPKTDLSGKHKKLTNFWRMKSGKIFILPAGDWLVQGVLADFKHVTVKKQISLKSEEEIPYNFVLNAGQVKFEIKLNGKSYKGEVAWDVYTTKTDFSGKRNKIVNAWRVKSGRITVLPAGKYLVIAYNPDKKETKGEITFNIGAGEEKTVQIKMKNP